MAWLDEVMTKYVDPFLKGMQMKDPQALIPSRGPVSMPDVGGAIDFAKQKYVDPLLAGMQGPNPRALIPGRAPTPGEVYGDIRSGAGAISGLMPRSATPRGDVLSALKPWFGGGKSEAFAAQPTALNPNRPPSAEIGPQAIRRVASRAVGGSNYLDLPIGEYLRLMANPDIAASRTALPTAPELTAPRALPVGAPTESTPDFVGRARTDALSSIEGAPSGTALLPWDFWQQHPNVRGGVARVESGPMAGKTYSMFEESRPEPAGSSILANLEQTLSQMAANPKGTTAKKLQALAGLYNYILDDRIKAAKSPAEIAELTARAENLRRGTTWPGQDIWNFPPAGGAIKVAQGREEKPGTPGTISADDKLLAASLPHLIDMAGKVVIDPLASESDKLEAKAFLNRLGGNLMGRPGMAGGPGKISRAEAVKQLKSTGKYTDEQINAYLDQRGIR